MKTVGQLLKSARLKQNLTLETVAQQSKIRRVHLESLEEDDYQKLPSATYTRGFIRNYALFLGLTPESLLAVFRRDFSEDHQGQIIPRSMIEPTQTPPWWYSKIIAWTATGFAFALFLGFLIVQYTSLVRPKLVIISPEEGQIVTRDTVHVSGVTDSSAVVTINNQLVAVTASGSFEADIRLPSGDSTVEIQAANRNNNKTVIKRRVNMRSTNNSTP